MNSWNESLVGSLRRIGGLCKSYKIMHMKSSVWYRRRSDYANNMGLVGAAIAALIKGAQDYSDFSFLPDWLPEIGGIIAGGALLVLRMGRYEESVHTHKTTAAELASLIENIQRQLTLPVNARMPGLSYYEWVAKSYDNIVQSADPIPPTIQKEFIKLSGKRKLVVPDEFLLNDNFSDDTHIELASLQLFNAGPEEPTPSVNPREMPIPIAVGDIEVGSLKSPTENGGSLDNSPHSPTRMADLAVDSDSTSVKSDDTQNSRVRMGWGRLVRALGQYNDTNMRHDMERFERICGVVPSSINRGTTMP